MSLRYFSIILLILIISFSSCRSLVTDEFDNFPQKIVVNSIIKAEERINVNVSLTGNINDDILPLVENAKISLFINDKFCEYLTYVGEGNYRSTTIPHENDKISCIVVSDTDTARCSCIIPVKIIPKDIDFFEFVDIDDNGYPLDGLRFTFDNNTQQTEYIEINIFTSNNNMDDRLNFRPAYIENITDPIIQQGGVPIPIFSTEYIEDNVYNVELHFIRSGGIDYSSYDPSTGEYQYIKMPIFIKIANVDRTYYNYRKEYYLYQEARYSDGITDFSGTQNISSNIENGYGIFAAYTEYIPDTIYPK